MNGSSLLNYCSRGYIYRYHGTSLVRSIIISVHCIVYWEYEMLLVMMMKCVDVSNVKHT